ncbi:MAG: VPLPA-CTERM sorting domain-containing protein [Paracoccaceae bacterium]|jgi:hypothetical protein|nr:VPLPA-CTERM sorting domain-containing protein [Paracoccaceae bacterium]
MRKLFAMAMSVLAAQAAGAATYTDRSAFDTALAGLGLAPSIEDYDGVVSPLVLADGDSVGAITHSSTIDGGAFDLVVRNVLGNNELGALSPSGGEGDFGLTDEITFSFAPTTAFGLDFIASVTELFDDEITLSFAGESVSNVAQSTASGDVLFFGIVTAGAPASTATLSFDTDITLGGVDNITLAADTADMPVIPLPASVFMLLAGLGAIGAMRASRMA